MTNFRSDFSIFLNDVKVLFSHSDMIFNLALEDLRDRYRKSYIGIIWITLSFVLFIGVKLLIFSRLNSNPDVNFGVSLVVGFGTWLFISSTITEGANAFNSNKTWILSCSMPYMSYIYQNTVRNFVNWLLIVAGMIPLLLLFGLNLSFSLISIIPAVALMVLASVWSSMFLAPLSTYSKDFNHLLTTFMRIMFFATPIIWVPGNDPMLLFVASINPFYHFIELIRAPILNQEIAWQSWLVVALITPIGFLMGALSYVCSRRHVPFWI